MWYKCTEDRAGFEQKTCAGFTPTHRTSLIAARFIGSTCSIRFSRLTADLFRCSGTENSPAVHHTHITNQTYQYIVISSVLLNHSIFHVYWFPFCTCDLTQPVNQIHTSHVRPRHCRHVCNSLPICIYSPQCFTIWNYVLHNVTLIDDVCSKQLHCRLNHLHVI